MEFVLGNNHFWSSYGLFRDTMDKEEISTNMNALKQQILELLIKAYTQAVFFMEKENEAVVLAAELGEENPKFKEKQKDAAKYRIAAQIIVKQKASPLLGELFGHENKAHAASLDLLRNKINTMCMNIFADEPEHRQFIIKAKNRSKNEALEFIAKLKQELS